MWVLLLSKQYCLREELLYSPQLYLEASLMARHRCRW